MTFTLPPTLPFCLHILIELPASINFFLFPSAQVSTSASTPPVSAPAGALIRQYAVLLLSSNLIALIFALQPINSTSRQVAGALAVYHLAPVIRAGSRIRAGELELGQKVEGSRMKGLGGPLLHFAVHSVCLLGLVGLFVLR